MQRGGQSPPRWMYFYVTTHQPRERARPLVFFSDNHQPWERARLLVLGPFSDNPPAPRTSMTARFRGFNPSLTTTNPENEHDPSFSGFQLFSDNHQPQERAWPLVFRVSILLTTTNPENEHDRSFLGFQPFSDNYQLQERARLLVFGVCPLLWQPPAPKTSTTAHFRGFACFLTTTSPENEHYRSFSV